MPRLPRHFLLAALAVAALIGSVVRVSAAISPPPGFVVDDPFPTAVFQQPLQVVFLPGGRALVVEKDGRIWMMNAAGQQLETPFLDLREKVLSTGDRGLLGVALDPEFMLNHWVYVTYDVDPDSNGVDSEVHTWARLERYRTSVADSNVLDLSSREVLIGCDWSSGLPAPTHDQAHSIGTIRFGRDGTLFLGNGDAGAYSTGDVGGLDPDAFGPGKTDPAEDIGSFRAQSLNSLCGKILRLDKETGHGLPSNPYWDGNPVSARSRVWIYGVRNPYRFTFRPGTGSESPEEAQPGALYIADVGWYTWEELDIARGGGLNFGWPCVEGPEANPWFTQATQPPGIDCGAYGSPTDPTSPSEPVLYWSHNDSSLSSPAGATARCIIAGAFYEGTSYPTAYRGRMFFADFSTGWLRVAETDENDRIVSVSEFMDSGVEGLVDLEVNPSTGDIWYVSVYSSLVQRLRYVTGNHDPVVVATAAPLYGATPLVVNVDASTSLDPDGDALSFMWKFGDGDSATTAAAQHTYTQDGAWTILLDVTDGHGGLARRAFDVVGGQVPPPGEIVLPLQRQRFFTGDSVALQAVEVDPALGPATYRWDVDLGHLEHFHLSELVMFGPTARYRFTLLNDVEPMFNRIRLAVTQGALTIRDTVNVYPDLDADLASLTTSVRTPRFDEPFDATLLVRSRGPFGTRQFRWQLFDGDSLLQDRTYRGIIPAGDSLAFTASVGPLAPGAHVLRAVIDPDSQLVERDETDNERTIALFVRGARGEFAAWDADLAGGTGPLPNGDGSSPWADLVGAFDGSLAGFSGGGDGWSGDGTNSSPHRLEFDGVDDRVVLAPAGAMGELAAHGQSSVEIWFRAPADVSRPQSLFDCVAQYTLPWEGLSLGLAGGRLRADLAPWRDCAPIQPGSWHQAMLAKSADSVRVWLDGRRVLTGAYANFGPANSAVVLGASTHAGPGQFTDHFGGAVSLVRLYPAALEDDEVRTAFQRDSSRLMPPAPRAPSRLVAFAADSASGAGPNPVPGAASPWRDLAGEGHDGALESFAAPGEASGWNGDGRPASPYRLEFDGLDDRVAVAAGSVPGLQAPDSLSVSLWFRGGADTNRPQTLLEWGADTSASSPGMRVGLESGVLAVNGTSLAGAPLLPPLTWHHVLVAETGFTRLVVLDGRIVCSDFAPHLGPQLSELVLGNSTSGERPFRGAIARLEIWRGTLDSLSAFALYASQASPFLNRIEAAGPAGFVSVDSACASIAVVYTRALAKPIRGYSVLLRIDPTLTVCGPGIESAHALGPDDATVFEVNDQGVGLWEVSESRLGAGCADPGGVPLFTIHVGGAVPSGQGRVTFVAAEVRDCANQPVVIEPGAAVDVTIDRVAPAPVSALSAAALDATAGTDRRRLKLTFTTPADVESVSVYRAPFGNYPEYDDEPGAGGEPAAPAYPPAAPWQQVLASANGRSDLPGVRDVWHYVAFAWDSCGNRSAASAVSRGVPDYALGDFAAGGDGLVTLTDLDLLMAHFGATLGPSDPLAVLDVGPTSDSTLTGRPTTDNRLDFEDLAILALGWSAPSLPAADSTGVESLAMDFASYPSDVDTFTAVLQFRGSGRVHCMDIRLAYDSTRVLPIGWTSGPMLGTCALPAVFASPNLDVADIALLGQGPGIAGGGHLASVTFRRIAEGKDRLRIASVLARDGANRPVPVLVGESIAGVEATPPLALSFERAGPEPSSQGAAFLLTLPAEGRVRMRAYDVQGRSMREVRDGRLPAGRHRLVWDGRDDSGNAVRPGIYLMRLEAGGRVFVRRVTLLR